MKHGLVFSGLPLVALFLTLSPVALASNTWYVDGMHGDDNNNCKSRQSACKTIGHAISLASSGDSIMVAAAVYQENLTIDFSLKIVGSDAKTTIIDGGGVDNVIYVPGSSTSVVISALTIRNGGRGIVNYGMLSVNKAIITKNTSQQGAGINNVGTVTLNDSTLSGNTAVYAYDDWGGAIYNSGTVTLNRSTLTLNSVSANYAYGGGIYSTGTLTINNSTISGNRAAGVSDGGGGGIAAGGTLTINNSTISGNGATLYGGAGFGGGNAPKATFRNSIVANNTMGGNCSGSITSKGYNLSSDNTCHFKSTGDLNDTNPKLGPLQNNGGPTQTQALLPGSPAIDAGNPSGCTDGKGHLLKTDQRGKPRPDKGDTGGCDMGSYERQQD
jgi:predicted outer membrane repeat protein